VETTNEPQLVTKYGPMIYPTLLWTGPEGDVRAITVQPDTADDALPDLEHARSSLHTQRP
jgi:hypothetical protein